MKVTVKTGILFAILWIIVKLAIFGMGKANDFYDFIILFNALCLLCAVALGLYIQKRSESESNALRDMKNGMLSGVTYIVIVCSFIFFYYKSIDKEFCEHKLTEAKTTVEKMLNDPIQFKKFKASNEAYETMTKEEILKQSYSNIEANISAKTVTIMSLLALLFLSTLNSLLVTVIFRKIIFSEKAIKK